MHRPNAMAQDKVRLGIAFMYFSSGTMGTRGRTAGIADRQRVAIDETSLSRRKSSDDRRGRNFFCARRSESLAPHHRKFRTAPFGKRRIRQESTPTAPLCHRRSETYLAPAGESQDSPRFGGILRLRTDQHGATPAPSPCGSAHSLRRISESNGRACMMSLHDLRSFRISMKSAKSPSIHRDFGIKNRPRCIGRFFSPSIVSRPI